MFFVQSICFQIRKGDLFGSFYLENSDDRLGPEKSGETSSATFEMR